MERIPLKPPGRRTWTRQVVAVLPAGAPRLTVKEAMFVQEYLVDYNASRAAKAAGWQRPGEIGYWLLRKPHILAEINRQQGEARRKLQLRREDLMQIWYDLAHADVREVIPLKVRCCRHCWGIEHQYQFTGGELRALYLKHRMAYRNSRGEPPDMDEKGGDGFDQRRPPFAVANGQDHDCPECFGLGAQVAEPIDLGQLSRGAQLLIGGVKVDKSGIVEIKFNDRLRAVEKLEQYMGFIKPKRGIWVVDFDEMGDEQLDALLSEARSRGLLQEEEVQEAMKDVTPADA